MRETALNLVRYIARRFILASFVLLGVLVITFIISHSFGNPVVAWLGKSAGMHPNLVQIYVNEYHLNDPLYIQFFYYVQGIFHGNFGYSPSQGFQPVSEVIAQTLPYTLQIAFFAIVLTLVMGVVLGIVASFYYKRPIDRGIRGFYLVGYSSPSFFIALILLIVFVYIFQILPSGGAANPVLGVPNAITGIPMLDSLIDGDLPYFVSSLQHVILPSLALALTTFGVVTRMVRSSLRDVMQSNYIRTARAKGVGERSVFIKHGLRNALIPVVTVSSLVITGLLTGTVFVESVFSYPGIGQYLVQAIVAQDYPGILGVTLIFATIIILTNLTADILYVVADPRLGWADMAISKEKDRISWNRSRLTFLTGGTQIHWNKEMIIGGAIIAFFLLLAIVVEIAMLFRIQVTPYNPIQQNVGPLLVSPSFTHLMGTDQLGRDLFSRLIAATPNAVSIGFVVVGFSMALGIIIGSFAGFKGGFFDEALMRTTDVVFAIPSLILAIAIVVALGPGIVTLLLVLMIVWWPPYARLARGETLKVSHQSYIEAARTSGLDSARIIINHVIPNIFQTMVVYATLDIGTVILAYSGLSYLGLSVPPPAPDWGQMVSAYQNYLISAPWLPIFPGMFIALGIVGFSIFGDGLRDAIAGA